MISFEKTLERWTSVVGLISSLSLVSAIVFDLGYFNVIGSKYMLFLGVSEHLISAVSWLPSGALFVIGVYLLFSDAQIIVSALRKKTLREHFLARTVRVSSGAIALIFAFAIALSVNSVFISLGLKSYFFLFLAVLVFQGLLIGLAHVSTNVQKAFEHFSLQLVLCVVAPLWVSVVFWMGSSAASYDMSSFAKSYEISVEGATRNVADSYKILRAYSGGLIVFNSTESRVMAIPSDRILFVKSDDEIGDIWFWFWGKE